jgi:maleamate amidohydrolase
VAAADDLKLPDDLRAAVHVHLRDLRRGFERRGWGGRVRFGVRPALIVIDLATLWTGGTPPIGSDLDAVVLHTRRVLDAARAAGIPIFFTTVAYAEDDPVSPGNVKEPGFRAEAVAGSPIVAIDERLARRPTEKLIVKKYASCFEGTDLRAMLIALGVDTLVVTGCSTSHCVYATCRDAVSGYRVIVPEEAVGDRCELLHLTSLLDIDLALGDVMSVAAVVRHLGGAGEPERGEA